MAVLVVALLAPILYIGPKTGPSTTGAVIGGFALVLMFLILGACFVGGVWFKYGYDLREASGGAPELKRQLEHVGQVLPGLVLDRYGDLVVGQIATAGMEALRESI